MELLFATWKDSTRPFLISNSQTITYGKLHEDLLLSLTTLENSFKEKQLFVIESLNTYETYLKFLSLILQKHVVFLSPAYQFNDPEFRAMLEKETQSSFHYISSDHKLTTVTKKTSSMHPLIQKQFESKCPAFIVRTSGTSGKKFKFVLHEPARFIKKYQAIENYFFRTLAFFPADSIAGIETLLEVITYSNTLVSENEKLTPTHVNDLIHKYQIDYLHATPSFLNLMLIAGVFSHDLRELKTIAFGSEPVSASTMTEIKNKQSHITFKHIYGMSEIGLLSTITNQMNPSTFILDKKINAAQVVNHELEIQSMTQSLGYLNYENNEGPWFKTGDVVSVENDGFLKIIGRVDDLINVAGKKFYPSEVEDLLIKMPGVLDVAVLSEKNEIIGNIIIAKFFIDPSLDEFTFRAALKNYCEEFMPYFMCPHKVILLKGPPITTRFKKSRTL
jgi:acyl-coenzyme A synthetase/AMP-(fatty) acid ligase